MVKKLTISGDSYNFSCSLFIKTINYALSQEPKVIVNINCIFG